MLTNRDRILGMNSSNWSAQQRYDSLCGRVTIWDPGCMIPGCTALWLWPVLVIVMIIALILLFGRGYFGATGTGIVCNPATEGWLAGPETLIEIAGIQRWKDSEKANCF